MGWETVVLQGGSLIYKQSSFQGIDNDSMTYHHLATITAFLFHIQSLSFSVFQDVQCYFYILSLSK